MRTIALSAVALINLVAAWFIVAPGFSSDGGRALTVSVTTLILLGANLVAVAAATAAIVTAKRHIWVKNALYDAKQSRIDIAFAEAVYRLFVLREVAYTASHPILAAEIEQSLADAYSIWPGILPWLPAHLSPAVAPAAEEEANRAASAEHAGMHLSAAIQFLEQHAIAGYEARVSRARLAYRFNLPLCKENAINFAAARMATRIGQVSGFVEPRVHAFIVGEKLDGSNA